MALINSKKKKEKKKEIIWLITTNGVLTVLKEREKWIWINVNTQSYSMSNIRCGYKFCVVWICKELIMSVSLKEKYSILL